MTSFDTFCLWLGYIVLGGSTCLIILTIMLLCMFKLFEKIWGKKEMDRRFEMMENIQKTLLWTKSYIENEKIAKETARPLPTEDKTLLWTPAMAIAASDAAKTAKPLPPEGRMIKEGCPPEREDCK